MMHDNYREFLYETAERLLLFFGAMYISIVLHGSVVVQVGHKPPFAKTPQVYLVVGKGLTGKTVLKGYAGAFLHERYSSIV